MSTPWSRPDLDTFRTGFYIHAHSGELVAFEGIATMPELHGEDVAVFRFVDDPASGCLVATRAGYNKGETFSRIVCHFHGSQPDEEAAGVCCDRCCLHGDDCDENVGLTRRHSFGVTQLRRR